VTNQVIVRFKAVDQLPVLLVSSNLKFTQWQDFPAQIDKLLNHTLFNSNDYFTAYFTHATIDNYLSRIVESAYKFVQALDS